MPRLYYTVKGQDDHDTYACKALWSAVILQAIEDAAKVRTVKKPGSRAKIKADAIRFLTTTDSDFAFNAIGLDPATARKAIRTNLSL